VRTKVTRIKIAAIVLFAALVGTFFVATSPASAHGCTYTLGYYKNNLDKLLAADPNFHIPFPATGATQQDKLASTVAILSYSGSDPVQKLEKLTAALTLGNDIGDMQGSVYTQYLAAQDFLMGKTTASTAQILAWADLLDSFNSGNQGTAHCV